MEYTTKSIIKDLQDYRSHEIDLQTQEAVLTRLMLREQKYGNIDLKSKEYRTRIQQQIADNTEHYLRILEYLEVLHGEMRSVLEMYYILGESWSNVAKKLYQSERNIYLLRNKAIKTIVTTLNQKGRAY